MKLPIYQVDAFSSKLFGGNPAAICPLDEWIDTALMQSIALENNLSETAFFVRKGNRFDLKWFTPEMEMDLCGHATLASAHVIFNHLGYEADRIVFDSQSGELAVSKTNDLLSMDFPSRVPTLHEPAPNILKGLRRPPLKSLKARDYLFIYENEEEVLSIQPDFDQLNKTEYGTAGIILSAPGKEVDFVSRFLMPNSVVKEDPVTGSAHSTLIPYWAKELKKDKLHAYQVSKRRGELFCENRGDRVLISGKSVTYLKGEIYI